MKKRRTNKRKTSIKRRKNKRRTRKQRGGGVSYMGSLFTFIASVGASVGINEYLKDQK